MAAVLGMTVPTGTVDNTFTVVLTSDIALESSSLDVGDFVLRRENGEFTGLNSTNANLTAVAGTFNWNLNFDLGNADFDNNFTVRLRPNRITDSVGDTVPSSSINSDEFHIDSDYVEPVEEVIDVSAISGYIPFKIIIDVIASWLTIPDQVGTIGTSETLDLSDYFDDGYPVWALTRGDVSFEESADIGGTPTVYSGTIFATIANAILTWTPPEVPSNRRWYIELILTNSEDSTETVDTELILDVAREALWTDEGGEALWTDKYGFPLWTE